MVKNLLLPLLLIGNLMSNNLLTPGEGRIIDIGQKTQKESIEVPREWLGHTPTMVQVENDLKVTARILSEVADCYTDDGGRESCPHDAIECEMGEEAVVYDSGIATLIDTSVTHPVYCYDDSSYVQQRDRCEKQPTPVTEDSIVCNNSWQTVTDSSKGNRGIKYTCVYDTHVSIRQWFVGTDVEIDMGEHDLSGPVGTTIHSGAYAYGSGKFIADNGILYDYHRASDFSIKKTESGIDINIVNEYTELEDDLSYTVIRGSNDTVLPANDHWLDCGDLNLVYYIDADGRSVPVCEHAPDCRNTYQRTLSMCVKKYAFWRYECDGTPDEYGRIWTKVVETYEDCLGNCGDYGCVCNTDDTPENMCRKEDITCPLEGVSECVKIADPDVDAITITAGYEFDPGYATGAHHGELTSPKECFSNDGYIVGYNMQEDRCEHAPDILCKKDFSYQNGICVADQECPMGIEDNGDCVMEPIFDCGENSGYVYDPTSDSRRCEARAHEQGCIHTANIYDEGSKDCTSPWEMTCTSDYLDLGTAGKYAVTTNEDRCEKAPDCNGKGSFNHSSHRCEADGTISTPQSYPATLTCVTPGYAKVYRPGAVGTVFDYRCEKAP